MEIATAVMLMRNVPIPSAVTSANAIQVSLVTGKPVLVRKATFWFLVFCFPPTLVGIGTLELTLVCVCPFQEFLGLPHWSRDKGGKGTYEVVVKNLEGWNPPLYTVGLIF